MSLYNYDKGFYAGLSEKLTKYKIGTDLFPMLRKKESFDLEVAKKSVKEFIESVIILTSQE